MDITPFLDKKSKTPLYEQLYTFLNKKFHMRESQREQDFRQNAGSPACSMSARQL